jgi:hypothetical protein
MLVTLEVLGYRGLSREKIEHSTEVFVWDGKAKDWNYGHFEGSVAWIVYFQIDGWFLRPISCATYDGELSVEIPAIEDWVEMRTLIDEWSSLLNNMADAINDLEL